MNTFHHRIAIVTGASRSRGIGTAICRALATGGADVFFTHWGTYDAAMPWGAEENWPALLQRELQAMGVRCESMAVDLSAIAWRLWRLPERDHDLRAQRTETSNACVSPTPAEEKDED